MTSVTLVSRIPTIRTRDVCAFGTRKPAAESAIGLCVVRAAMHLPPAIRIAAREVAVHPQVRQARPITLKVTFAVVPQPAREANGGGSHHQLAGKVGGNGRPIGINDIGAGARDRAREGARLERMNNDARCVFR